MIDIRYLYILRSYCCGEYSSSTQLQKWVQRVRVIVLTRNAIYMRKRVNIGGVFCLSHDEFARGVFSRLMYCWAPKQGGGRSQKNCHNHSGKVVVVVDIVEMVVSLSIISPQNLELFIKSRSERQRPVAFSPRRLEKKKKSHSCTSFELRERPKVFLFTINMMIAPWGVRVVIKRLSQPLSCQQTSCAPCVLASQFQLPIQTTADNNRLRKGANHHGCLWTTTAVSYH